jgi:hypothetical protein
MGKLARDTGLNVDDESWTWDDLARELTGKFKIPDLSELVRILEEKEPGILEDLGYVKK